MDLRHAFLAAINEHYADPAPRLVYADWLDEQGEAGKAAAYRRYAANLARETPVSERPIHTHEAPGPPHAAGRGREGRTMKTTETITRVTCRWDDQPGVEPAWYCESWAADRMVDDSQKVWFPVAVDDYGRGDADDLSAALAEAFPGAEIVID
jgi:uncharacterized protein (TIGR02996 family)